MQYYKLIKLPSKTLFILIFIILLLIPPKLHWQIPEGNYSGENGDVKKAEVLKGIGAGCDEAAVAANLKT